MDDPLQVVFALTFPILLGITIVVAVMLLRGTGLRAPDVLAAPDPEARGGRFLGDVRLVVIWLILSATTLLATFIVGFAVVHALLFVFGTSVATAALVGGTLLLAAIPIAWGLLIRRHVRGGRS